MDDHLFGRTPQGEERAAHRRTFGEERVPFGEKPPIAFSPHGITCELSRVRPVEARDHRQADGSPHVEHFGPSRAEMRVDQTRALPTQHAREEYRPQPVTPSPPKTEPDLSRVPQIAVRVEPRKREHIEILGLLGDDDRRVPSHVDQGRVYPAARAEQIRGHEMSDHRKAFPAFGRTAHRPLTPGCHPATGPHALPRHWSTRATPRRTRPRSRRSAPGLRALRYMRPAPPSAPGREGRRVAIERGPEMVPGFRIRHRRRPG